ncbi:hypothetical protein J4233_03545 [Candidatus Pacearchaeota archaeon]|nr:hypothetical protein [Candidatus Pacearchaeota archaeon]
MKKKGKKYDPNPTPKKILIVLLALVFGNILFAYSATIASAMPMASFFFEPAILSTSILLATASYIIISLVRD